MPARTKSCATPICAHPKRPDVPRCQIGAFRNVLVHDYARVDADAVCGVIELHLPVLDQAVRAMRGAPLMEPASRDA
jgi:uncharacterized protein with HEPN domain